uniref:Uncharacterized protein n=1 Tax=Anguilla anguilla TaxID=7936 RepID=A0A0E9R3Q2_ANGAN
MLKPSLNDLSSLDFCQNRTS